MSPRLLRPICPPRRSRRTKSCCSSWRAAPVTPRWPARVRRRHHGLELDRPPHGGAGVRPAAGRDADPARRVRSAGPDRARGKRPSDRPHPGRLDSAPRPDVALAAQRHGVSAGARCRCGGPRRHANRLDLAGAGQSRRTGRRMPARKWAQGSGHSRLSPLARAARAGSDRRARGSAIDDPRRRYSAGRRGRARRGRHHPGQPGAAIRRPDRSRRPGRDSAERQAAPHPAGQRRRASPGPAAAGGGVAGASCRLR